MRSTTLIRVQGDLVIAAVCPFVTAGVSSGTSRLRFSTGVIRVTTGSTPTL